MKKKLVTLITEPIDYSGKAIATYESLGPVYDLTSLTKGKGWPMENPSLVEGNLAYKQLREVLPKINILAIGLKYKIDKEWLNRMPNLKVVGWQGTGLNHIDVKALKERGVKLISLRGRKGFLKNIPSTAEQTMGLLLAAVRHLPWSFDAVINKNSWDRVQWRGMQLYQKTIGLIGFGRLGRIMSRYAKAFGMKVISYDPHVSKSLMKRVGAQKVNLDELLKKSDIVSLHATLTDKNHNLLQEEHFQMMKPNAVLVNTARGELIEKGALEKALSNRWISRAAIDVMWDEQSDGGHLAGNPLVEYAKANKNLIIVPHLGGATFEAMEVTQEIIADLVKKYFLK